MQYTKFWKLLNKKHLTIDVNDEMFDKLINKFGFSNIFQHSYVVPFLQINSEYKNNGDKKLPHELFNENSFKANVKFTDIIEFVKLDIWFGNLITEIYQYVENLLLCKIENLIENNNSKIVNIFKPIDSGLLEILANYDYFFSMTDFVITMTYGKDNNINKTLSNALDRLTFKGTIRLFQNLKPEHQKQIIKSYNFDSNWMVTTTTLLYICDSTRLCRNDSTHFQPVYDSKFNSKILNYTYINKNNTKSEEELLNFFNNFKNSVNLPTNPVHFTMELISNFSILEGIQIIKTLFDLHEIADPILDKINEKFNCYFNKISDIDGGTVVAYIKEKLKK